MSSDDLDKDFISNKLNFIIHKARSNKDGAAANYIPELANVDLNHLNAAIQLTDGDIITAGDDPQHLFTIQSVSKLILLIGLLEEYGADQVFSWIGVEPSGKPFAAVGELDQYGPVPSNPLINAGALVLSSYIPGDESAQMQWVDYWVKTLFSEPDLTYSEQVFTSELGSADRNRSLAYLMRSTGIITREVEQLLLPYCALCSYQVNIRQATNFAVLLAMGGIMPNGQRIISQQTARYVVAIMATCGMYNESGMHLLTAGLPAKSGVSGLIIATAIGNAGVATYSPRVNKNGNSPRGQFILNEISNQFGWHFAE